MENKKLNTNSNVYTIVYAVVIVIIVALLLAFTSSSLKDRQNNNVALDKQKQILTALNVDYKGLDAAQLYNEIVSEAIIINCKAETQSENRDEAFSLDIKKQSTLPLEVRQLPVYIAHIDGQTKYVFPVTGAGLWGGIWGYVAVNDDKNTIFGTFFNHESETPGLGAEIKKPDFQHKFIGKHLLNENQEFVSVAITKNGAPAEGQEQVDALSGATITSKGVEAMLLNSLGQYKAFLVSENASNEDAEANSEEDIAPLANSVPPTFNE